MLLIVFTKVVLVMLIKMQNLRFFGLLVLEQLFFEEAKALQI